jgi:fructose 1,6-bisphosphate aldolase/phosphatase
MAERAKLTLSVINAAVGGFVGHVCTHPDILDTAKEQLLNAQDKGIITDFHLLRCGDEIGLVLTHLNGCESALIREFAWKTFQACSKTADELKLYRDDETAFGERDRTGSGPGLVEMEFVERSSEPVVILMANKALAGAWNLPIYKIFADPFNTVGLIIDPEMFEGFSFKILDTEEGTWLTLRTPVDTYSLLALITIPFRYVITNVYRFSDHETAAMVSTRSLSNADTGFLSRDNPMAVLRCQGGFPAIGEALESFSMPHLVNGWMRQTYSGPLMPVPFYEATPTRFDGPPRLIGAGFQISNGRLLGPHDMFDDPSFDETRRLANRITEYMRRHGPFQPHQKPREGSVHTALPTILDRLKEKFSR